MKSVRVFAYVYTFCEAAQFNIILIPPSHVIILHQPLNFKNCSPICVKFGYKIICVFFKSMVTAYTGAISRDDYSKLSNYYFTYKDDLSLCLIDRSATDIYHCFFYDHSFYHTFYMLYRRKCKTFTLTICRYTH